MHVDPRPFGGDEMPGLVHENQHAQHDGESQDRRQHALPHKFTGPLARPAVGGSHDFDIGGRLAAVVVERVLDYVTDAAERDAAVEKRGDGHLVGGVEDRRGRAAGPPGRDPGVVGAEHLRPHRLERERARGHRVEAADAGVGETPGVGQRVQNRQLHGREGELREHAPVAELDEGVDDALRVDHHLQRVVRQAEQMVRLDDLQRLVRQRGAVHRDLLPHAPGRVVERVGHGGDGEPLGPPFAEGAARAGENEPLRPPPAGRRCTEAPRCAPNRPARSRRRRRAPRPPRDRRP